MKDSIAGLASISFVGGLFGYGSRYLLNIIIARGFGIEALGVFAIGLVVLKGGSVFARLGLDQAAQKFIPIYVKDGDERKVRGLIVLCYVLPFTVGVALAGGVTFVAIYTNIIKEALIPFAIGIPLFAVLSVTVNATRGFKETKYKVYARDIGQTGTAVVLVSVIAFVIHDFTIAIAGYLFSLIVGIVLVSYFLLRQPAVRGDSITYESKRVLRFAVPLLLVSVGRYLVEWIDILMLNAFGTTANVGKYQAVYQTSMLLLFVLHSATSIFPSFASELYDSGRNEHLQQVYTATTKWVVHITALGGIFLMIFSDEILQLFSVSDPSAMQALLILAVTQTITVSAGPVGFLLSMSDYERLEALNTGIALVTNVVLNFVLIRRFGIVGAAAATGLSLAFRNVIGVMQVWYFLGMTPYTWAYWKGFVALVPSTAVMVFVRMGISNPLGRIFLSGTLALLVFAISLVLLGFDDDDYVLVESVRG